MTIAGRSCRRIRQSAGRKDQAVCHDLTPICQKNPSRLIILYKKFTHLGMQTDAHVLFFHGTLQRTDDIRCMIRYRKGTVAPFYFIGHALIFKEIHDRIIGKGIKGTVQKLGIGNHCLHDLF